MAKINIVVYICHVYYKQCPKITPAIVNIKVILCPTMIFLLLLLLTPLLAGADRK